MEARLAFKLLVAAGRGVRVHGLHCQSRFVMVVQARVRPGRIGPVPGRRRRSAGTSRLVGDIIMMITRQARGSR